MVISLLSSYPCNTIHTVTFPTNKEKNNLKVKIDSKRIALQYPSIGIIVLRPAIDRLTFGFSPNKEFHQHFKTNVTPQEHREHIKGSLFHTAKVQAEGLSLVEGVPFMKAPWKSYNVHIRYKPPSGSESILIQIDHKQDGAFMRFDMNPRRFSDKALEEFRAFIEEKILTFPGVTVSYDDFIQWVAIFRADVAVDILGARPSDLEVIPIKKKKPYPAKSMSYSSETGRTETKYPKLKKSDSDNDEIYDKRKEQLDANKEPEFGDFLHSRYEWRVKKTTIRKLAKIQNRCGRIAVRALDLPKATKMKHTHHLFIRYALHRNLGKALNMIPSKHQPPYQKAYEENMHNIWHPDKIWSYWKETVTKSPLFPK